MTDDIDRAALDALPTFPQGGKDYARWTAWAKEALKSRDYRVIGCGVGAEKDPRYALALRSLIAAGVSMRAAPEESYDVAQRVFQQAHILPSPVIRAAERLLRLAMEGGGTTSDVLFLAGAFAWPLQHVTPGTGGYAWQYLVHAPWQTSSLVLKDFCTTALASGAVTAPRRVIDLARARLEAGLEDSAQELLEGMVLLAIDKKHIEAISGPGDVAELEDLPDIEQTVVALAKLYVARKNEQVYAREIVRKAAEIETVSSDLREVVRDRVWDRPLTEAYDWSREKKMDDLDREVRRVLDAGQPHHARRLCEAVITRELDKVVVGSPTSNVQNALSRFAELPVNAITSKFHLARAAEHLALIYSRTAYPVAGAQALVRKVVLEPALVGGGSDLAKVRPELETYLRECNPYGALATQQRRMNEARGQFTDDEKRAADDSQRWMEASFARNAGAAEVAIQAVTLPILDLGSFFGNAWETIVGVQDSSERALRYIARWASHLAGDLSDISCRGEALRRSDGAGTRLKDYARDVTGIEPVLAGLGGGASALLPPGFGLVTAAADIAVLLVFSFRAVARVGAAYGISMSSPEGLAFAADAFTLGCSSKDGEGLLAYVSRGAAHPIHKEVVLGGVAYGGMALAQHLWTATNQPATAVLQQAITNTARLLGISLAQKEAARVVPFAGALVMGWSAYAFVESIRDAAIEIAARDALLRKVGPA